MTLRPNPKFVTCPVTFRVMPQPSTLNPKTLSCPVACAYAALRCTYCAYPMCGAWDVGEGGGEACCKRVHVLQESRVSESCKSGKSWCSTKELVLHKRVGALQKSWRTSQAKRAASAPGRGLGYAGHSTCTVLPVAAAAAAALHRARAWRVYGFSRGLGPEGPNP